MIVGPVVSQDPTIRETIQRLEDGQKRMDRELKELKTRLDAMRKAEGRQIEEGPRKEFWEIEHLPGMG